jgi:hypothetical protein
VRAASAAASVGLNLSPSAQALAVVGADLLSLFKSDCIMAPSVCHAVAGACIAGSALRGHATQECECLWEVARVTGGTIHVAAPHIRYVATRLEVLRIAGATLDHLVGHGVASAWSVQEDQEGPIAAIVAGDADGACLECLAPHGGGVEVVNGQKTLVPLFVPWACFVRHLSVPFHASNDLMGGRISVIIR